jgi:hypothetical protein
VNHCRAEIFGACLAAFMPCDNLAAGSVVAHDRRVIDGQIIEPLRRVLDRIAAGTHRILDQPIGFNHGGARIVDEP